MPHSIGVRVAVALSHSIRTRVDGLSRKRVRVQRKAEPAIVEAREVGEHVASQSPELLVEPVEHGPTLNLDLLNDLLIEVVEQLLTSVILPDRDLGLQVLLQFVELKLDLLGRPAFLIDAGNALFEVHAGLNGTQNLVTSSKHAVEELELLVEQLVDAPVGGILLVQKVDHHDIKLLAVAVTPPDPLLNPLRIPREVVVHHEVAELQVDAFGGRLGCNKNGRTVSKMLNESGTHVGSRGTTNSIGAGMPLQPRLVNALRVSVSIGAVEDHHATGELGVL